MVSRLDILKAMATKLSDLTDPRRTSTDPMTMMLSSVPGMAPVAPFASALAHAIGGKVLENPVGKAATGLGYAAEAGTLGALEHALIPRQALEQQGIHVPSLLNTREGQAGQRALVALVGPGGGNPYQRMRAANEAAASGDEFAVGLTNAALDPTNLLGPAGKAMEATKLARLGSLLELTDQLQNMPLDQLAVLGKRGGAAAKQALIRRVLGTVEETTGKAGGIPLPDIPLVNGVRQYGPEGPVGALDLPLAPNAKEYRTAAQGAGLLPLPKSSPSAPSSLAPDAPNLLQLASQGGVEAAPLDLAGEVGRLAQYNAAARQAGLPELKALPGQASSLAPENFSLFRAAREQAAANKVVPPLPAPKSIQPVSSLVEAAQRTAQPTELEGLFGAAQRLGLNLPPEPPTQLVPRSGQLPLELARKATPLLPLPELPDVTGDLADRTFRAQADLQTAVEAAYGDKAAFAWPALLKKLGAVPDQFGRVVRDGQDITEQVLMYLDDHTKLPGRKAIDARYGQLAGDVIPPPDATPEQLADLIGDVPNVDIPAAATDDAKAAFDALIATRDDGKMGSYLPAPDFFAKRLGIPVEEAQRYIDDLVKQGVVGDAMGTLAFKPGARGAIKEAPPTLNFTGRELATPEELRAMRGTPDEAIRAANEENKSRFAERLAAFKAGVPVEQLPDVTPPSLRTNTPVGALPGVDMRPQFGGPLLTSIADKAIADAPMPLKLEMQYGGLAPEAVDRIKQVDAGQSSLFDAAEDTGTEALRAEFRQGLASAIERGKDDEAFAILDMAGDYGYPRGEASALYDELKGSGSLVDQQIQLIEASPYFSVFKHFNRNGELKKVNPITGKPLVVREGGKITKGRAEVWDIPGSGYDDVAAEAMASVGGYNQNNAADAGDFWRNARDAFKQYKQLKAGKEIAPSAFAGDIAAGGGGGGGLGIIPYPGGINGPVGRASLGMIGGGLTGAAGGATIGAMSDEDNRLGGAMRGASLGLAAGAGVGAGVGLKGPQLPAYLKPLLAHAGSEFKQGMIQGTEKSTGSVISAIKNLPTTWRIGTTEHFRNILGDEGWGRTVLGALTGKGAQTRLAALRNDMATRLKAVTPWEREPQQIQDIQRVLGRDGQVPILGDSLHQAETKFLTTTDTMIGGALLSATNLTNPLGLLTGTAIGAARPGIHAWFNAFNGFQQATFRRAAYLDEASQGLQVAAGILLPDLQRAGVDVSKLAPDGMFTVDDIRKVAGDSAADRWAALTDTVRESAENRTKFLFGDYSKKKGLVGAVERLAGGAIPFASWMVRAYPVGVAMLAQHPAVALGLYHYLQATKPDTEKGQPAYTAGMIPVPTDTPVIGAILKAYMGGEDGTAYIDPIGGISPFGGELVQPAQDDSGQNWYQKAQAWLSRTGLPGFNPLIQTAAYATGLDYKAPGNLSRTSGIEQGLGLIPGNPQLPNVVPNVLAATRRSLSPALEGVVPGVEADKSAQPFDPITRRYSELVYAETQKPLSDPSNQAYLVAMADPDNPLLQQARREVLLGGAAKNIASLTSPVGIVGQTAENKQYRTTAAAVPYSYDEIQRQKDAGFKLGDFMQQRNDQYKTANPAANMYAVKDTQDGAYELLRQWEAANKDFLFVAPAAYNRAKRKLMEQLGLIEPQKTGTK